MAKNILTPLQQKFLSAVSGNKKIPSSFYLTGGTALAAYYLKHRYSEDLDFFSKTNIDILSIEKNGEGQIRLAHRSHSARDAIPESERRKRPSADAQKNQPSRLARFLRGSRQIPFHGYIQEVVYEFSRPSRS
jgi:hypothetical protein